MLLTSNTSDKRLHDMQASPRTCLPVSIHRHACADTGVVNAPMDNHAYIHTNTGPAAQGRSTVPRSAPRPAGAAATSLQSETGSPVPRSPPSAPCAGGRRWGSRGSCTAHRGAANPDTAGTASTAVSSRSPEPTPAPHTPARAADTTNIPTYTICASGTGDTAPKRTRAHSTAQRQHPKTQGLSSASARGNNWTSCGTYGTVC